MVKEPVIQEIRDARVSAKGIALFIKREDEIHPFVSGNKWRKLKYNLLEAGEKGCTTLLTFGGAYSNHIYATAAAASEGGFKSIGIIRGEEHLPLNPTLTFAQRHGMQLHYMDRATYRKKQSQEVIAGLHKKFGEFYLIPEGGTNNLAIKGASEMIDAHVRAFDYVCLPVGTGGTIAGAIAGMQGQGRIIGFSALKGDFLRNDVNHLLQKYGGATQENWEINTAYHFGGYAKTQPALFQFIEEFYHLHHIQLDPIYTGKMMFGIYDMITKGYFEPGSKILAIHTGGLQGIAGMEERRKAGY